MSGAWQMCEDRTSNIKPAGVVKSGSITYHDLPLDLLSPILSQLSDRRDWHACALVSSAFNKAATPLLYRKLDSRIISKSVIHHPSATLLKRPELALHVRRVTETGAIHRGNILRYAHITQDTLKALSLCKYLESITWIDDDATTDCVLLSMIEVVREHPLREVIIRTHSDLGVNVWKELNTLTGLRKISVWCMEGPPRVLQGWSETLGATLTHLELGVSVHLYPCIERVPPTILISVLSQLPKLTDLRLKGAPAVTIPTILSHLKDLKSLDTEYPGGYYRETRRDDWRPESLPILQHLTIRASSIDSSGPQKLWGWILDLLPRAGLETLRLHAYTTSMNPGHTGLPRPFIMRMARVHGETLKHYILGDVELTLNDIECVCSLFPKLESLVCCSTIPDIECLSEAIAHGSNLQTLRLQANWFPSDPFAKRSATFTLEHARKLMLRSENSQLRLVGVGRSVYSGKWVLEEKSDEERCLKFHVNADVPEDRWKT